MKISTRFSFAKNFIVNLLVILESIKNYYSPLKTILLPIVCLLYYSTSRSQEATSPRRFNYPKCISIYSAGPEIATYDNANNLKLLGVNSSSEALKTVEITGEVPPIEARLEDTKTCTFPVTNTEEVPLDNIVHKGTLLDAGENTLALSSGLMYNRLNQGSSAGNPLVGETASYSTTYLVGQDALDAGGFRNSLFAVGYNLIGTTLDDSNDHDDDDETDRDAENDSSVITINSGPKISLVKTTMALEDTNGDGIAGGIDDVITYVFTVVNTGKLTLSNIVIEDNLPELDLMGGPIAQLLPGEIDETTYTATYLITQADIDVGSVTNSATVRGEQPGGDIDDPSDDILDTSDDPNDNENQDANGDGDPDDPTVTQVTSIYDLEVTKIVDEQNPVVGDQVTFTIEVANIGNVTATDIIINEQIPSGYVFISALTTLGTYSELNGEWTISQLIPDQLEILEITLEVIGNGEYLNTAFIQSSAGGVDVNTNNDEDEARVNPECLTVYNEFSPDGDGVNDSFVIDCIEQYSNNKLEVYNRWGNMVYSTNGYLNDWEGTLNGRAVINQSDKLPVGTYYYVLDLGDGSETRVGWLYINRRH